MPSTRVLVVDDHDAVRRSICSLLSSEPTLDVICQTATGEDAVIKAIELQPDLILMDISLPGISGIEAVRRIRKVSRESHIIFVSQHDSLQMVNEAFNVGGHGYLTKSDAHLELLMAVRAVRGGRRFVSQRLIEQGWETISGRHTLPI
jgi:two-component system, NarL family, response regulator NreC